MQTRRDNWATAGRAGRGRRRAVAALAWVLCAAAVRAGTTWDGGGADNNWGTGDNWNPNGTPGVGSGVDLRFAGSTRTSPYCNYTAWDDFRGIYFDSGASSFTITGNSLDLFNPGKIENQSSSAQSWNIDNFSFNSGAYQLNPVNGDLTLGGGNSIYNNGNAADVYGDNGKKLTIGKNLQGGGGLNVNQNSVVEFTTTSQFTGESIVNAGELRLTGVSLSGCPTVRVGATSGTAPARFRLGTTSSTTATNAIVIRSGSSGIKLVGGLNTSGVNTFSGRMYLDDHLTITNETGGTVEFSGQIQDGSGSGNYGITVDGGGTARFSGSGANSGVTSLTVRAGSTLELNKSAGTVAVNCDTTINAGGTLKLSAANQITDDIAVTANGAFNLNGNNETVGSIAGSGTIPLGTGQLIAGQNNLSTTFAGVISGTGTFVKKGATGVLALDGTNTWNGNIYPVGGTLQFSANQATGFGGEFFLGETSGSDSATLAIGAGGVVITNAITVRAGSSGVKYLSANNSVNIATFSGPIVLSNAVTLAANSGGTLTVSGTVNTGGSNLTVTTTGTINLDGTISGGGKVIKQGNGTVTLGATHTYTGNTEIDLGTLSVSGGIANGSAIYVGNGGSTGNATLALAANGVNLGSAITINTDPSSGTRTIAATAASGTTTLSGSLNVTRDVSIAATSGSALVLSGSSITLDTNRSDLNVNCASSSPVTISAPIAAVDGGCQINKTGTGTLTISGDNSTSVANQMMLNIQGGTVAISAKNNLGDDPTIAYTDKINFSGADGTLSATETINLTTSGNQWGLRINTVQATLSVASGKTLTIPGAIVDLTTPGTLVKSGTGTLTLSGVSSFSGATTVSAGELIASGSLNNSDVTVSSGAVLRGAGSVKSIVASGRVSPGNTASSTGQLTCNNSALTLNGGGSMTCKITKWTSPAAGTDFDQIKVGSSGAGTVTLNNTSGNTFTLYVDSNGVTPTGWDNSTELYWTIIDAGVISGAFDAATFTVDVSGFTPAETGTFTVETDGSGNIVLHYTPLVPTITLSSLSTLAFGNVTVNKTSAEQSYTVSGANLTADIVVTAPSGFEVSTTSGSGFSGSVTLTQSGGSVPSTTIYVRFKPTTVAAYTGNITHASAGATTKNKPVTGTGTAPPDPQSFSAAGGTQQVTLTFSLGPDSKPVVIVRNTSGTFTAPSGVPTLGAPLANGTVAYIGSTSPQVDGSLDAGQTYSYKAFSYDSVGDFYSAGLTANATTAPPAPVASAASVVDHLSFTANWAAAGGATAYRLDVATDSGFTAYVSGYQDQALGNVTSASVTVPRVGMYFYRVRATNAAGTSPNSNTIDVGSKQAQGRNKNGGSPYFTPSTVYAGDTVTFGADLWATINGSQGRGRAVANTTPTVGLGLYGSWGSRDSTDYTEASLKFLNSGTYYWGIQMDYDTAYGTNFWYVRNTAGWTDLYYDGTNGNLTLTVEALPNPTSVSATANAIRPDTKIDLSWARAGGYQVMVVRRAGAAPDVPVNGTAYVQGQPYGSGNESVVVYAAGTGTAVTNTGLSPSTTYYYAFYSENNSCYSPGASASASTAASAPAYLGVNPQSLAFETMLGSVPAVKTLVVTNMGGASMTYSNLVIAGTGGNWLIVTPTNGTLAVDAGTTHTAAVTLVAATGVYSATNWVNGNQGNPAQTMPVSLTVTNVPTPQGPSVTSIGTRHLTLGWTLDGYQALIVRTEDGAAPDAPANGTTYADGATYGTGQRNKVITSASSPSYQDNGVLPQTAYAYGLFGINNTYYSPGAYASATTLTAQVDGNANEWIATAGTVVNASTISGKEFIWRDKDGEQRNDAGEAVAGNNDIQEFRVRADANNVYFYVKLRDITDTATYPYIAIGVDTDRNPNDANGMNWVADDSGTTMGDGYYTNSNAQMHYPERNIIVHHVNGIGHRIELHADDGAAWYGPPTNGNTAVRFNGVDNFIEFRLTRTDLGLTGSITGRLSVAAYFNNTSLGANLWANDEDTTADYSVNDALDSLTVLRYGVDDAAGTRGAYGEDLDDGDLDTFMDLKFDAAGLVDNVVPPIPAAVYPTDNAVVEPGAFTFRWGAVTDTDDTLTSYFFELSDNATFNGGENYGITRRGNTTNTATSYVMEPAQTPATYYWRVRGRDLTGALSGAATRTYTIAGADDDIVGPQPSLVFVGPGYTNGAFSLSLTDADMQNTSDLVDIAVAWTDPSGVFMTNSPPHTSANIYDLNGRVIPNWDLFSSNTITTVTNSFGYDLPFSSFIGQNGGTSVTTVYHDAFSVLQINTNEYLYLTVSAEDEDNDRGTKPDPQGNGDAVPFDRTVITNVLVRFTVVDDDTNGPVFTSVNVSGAIFTNVNLAAGLTVTGLVQDAKSGVYGGTSNRYELYWFNQLVESGSFSTKPATDGSALSAPEPVGVALSPLSVTITGQYSLVCFATDFDHEHLADWAIGSGTFQFQVVQPPLPPGTKGTYFVIDNDWSGSATLPFVDSFDGLSAGALHGQNGWNATDSDIAVQSAAAYSGRAVSLVDGYGFHGVNAAGATDVWMDWYAKPQPKSAAPIYIRDVALKSTAAFYVNPSGYIVAMSNTTWVTHTHVVLATNAWVRFSVNLDYAADTWSLYAADSTPNALVTNVFRDVPFHTNLASTVLSVRMVEDGTTPAYVDSFAVGAAMPLSVDDDSDRMSDAWETEYLGGTAALPGTDVDGDQVNNRREYVAGTDPDDAASYLRVVSLDLASETATGVTLTWLGGDRMGPTNYRTAGDAIVRTYGLRAANEAPTNTMAQRATVVDTLTGTNAWLDANAVNLYRARYYHLAVSLGRDSYTNTEEWAMYVQPRAITNSYLVSVPVDVSSNAANNLNDRLGRQLMRGLRAGPAGGPYAQGDRLEFLTAAKGLKPYYLVTNDIGAAWWYDDDDNAPANLQVTPGLGFWVVRGSQPAARGNMIFGGRSYLDGTVVAQSVTLNDGGWNILGWPLATPRRQVNLGAATPPFALGFEADASGGTGYGQGTPLLQRGDVLFVWENNEWSRHVYWLMDHLGASWDHKWWDKFDNDFATITLEPGRAYYLKHVSNQWGGEDFTWRPVTP